MNRTDIVRELIRQRDALNVAIATIQAVAPIIEGTGKRRGRPPGSKNVPVFVESNPGPVRIIGTLPRKRKPFSAATRRKMAASQRKRWANRAAA